MPRPEFEQALLRRRCRLETGVDEWKTLGQMEHTRRRAVGNVRVPLMAGIVAYCLSDNTSALKLMRLNALAAL